MLEIKKDVEMPKSVMEDWIPISLMCLYLTKWQHKVTDLTQGCQSYGLINLSSQYTYLARFIYYTND